MISPTVFWPNRYDPGGNTWQFVQQMNVCRGGVGLTTLGGYLFAVGGHDGKAYLSSAEMYNPKTNTWEVVASMKTSRAGAGVVNLSTSSSCSSGLSPPSGIPCAHESFCSL